MVKLDRFDIVLNNAEHAYFAGQEISGKIIIEVLEAKKVNEILLEIKGRAKTYWTKHSGKSRRHCSSSEPYFCEQFNTFYTHKFDDNQINNNSKVNVINNDKNIASTSENLLISPIKKINFKNAKCREGRELPAGLHEIPFSYTLPKTLPSSFEGEYGFIRYTCRAICERPWDFDICSRCAFTVVGIKDINEGTYTLRPASNLMTFYNKQFWCINQGQINVEFNISRAGFTPGEIIKVNGRIENKSRKIIRSSNLSICQHVCYKAKTFSGVEHTKNTSRIVATIDKGEIRANDELKFANVDLIVPAVPPELTKSKIIYISYSVEIKISSCAKVSVPITIGTIPLISEIIRKKFSAINYNNYNGFTNDTHKLKKKNSTEQIKSNCVDDSTIVQVILTDETGIIATAITDDEKFLIDKVETKPELKKILNNKESDNSKITQITYKKRVRMPSSILSELYPMLPNPYYKESCFGQKCIFDETESNQFGNNLFAPKYPFFTDD